jgi:hypothetical protein
MSNAYRGGTKDWVVPCAHPTAMVCKIARVDEIELQVQHGKFISILRRKP